MYFVTSIYVDAPNTTVQRYDATQHRRIQVTCPKAVKSYNQFMGGTDKNDQMTRLQRCRRHYKWPRRLIMKFFMWAAYNAYILMGFQKQHNQPGQRLYTFHAFLERLCIHLVGEVRNTDHQGRRRSGADIDTRLQDTGRHHVERAPHATTNHRCVVCCEKYRRAKVANPQLSDKDLPKRKKAVVSCNFCEEFLCIETVDLNCWVDWHTKVAYWQ